MSTQPPRIRLYLDITDVGERGGTLSMLVAREHEEAVLMRTGTLEQLTDHLRPIIERGLYGASPPPPTESDHVGEATEKVGTDEKPPG